MFPPLFATNRGEIQMLHHKKMIIRDVWEVYSVYIYMKKVEVTAHHVII